MRSTKILFASAFCLLLVQSAFAQRDDGAPLATLSLDRPSALTPGTLSGKLGFRAFGGEEDVLYGDLAVAYGFGRGWDGLVKGSFGERRSRRIGEGRLRHGGNDVELTARRSLASGRVPVAALVGLSFADTPAQESAFPTLGLSLGYRMEQGASFVVNPRAVFIEDNALVGIGLGIEAPLGSGLSLTAEVTPLVAGDNTRSDSTGRLRRRALYGASLRYESQRGLGVELGVTNATGSTTGFSLTPGLGNGAALALSVFGRFGR